MAINAATANTEHGTAPSSKPNRYRSQGLSRLRDTVGADERSWPYLVSAVVGAAGIGLASLVGAAELAVGVAAAYVAYDVIARGVPLWDAIKQAEEEIRE